MRQSSKNMLLARDDVGRARNSTRDLPKGDHTFGAKIKRDPIGVSELTSEWVSQDQKVTSSKTYDKDFMRLNKIATRNKVTTCQQQSQLRSVMADHVRLREPQATPTRQRGAIRASHQDFYGKANRASTPIKDVVNSQYGTHAEVIQTLKNEYNENQFLQQGKFKGERKHTRATAMAAGYNSTRNSTVGRSHQDLYKMSQFKTVNSRVGPHHVNDGTRSCVRSKF